jgi:hypothetical protein
MQWNRCGLPILSLIAAVAVASPQTPSSQDVQKRVSPDAYVTAPATVREELKKQKCELPETQHWDKTRLNIVSGHFGDPAQTD